MKELFSGCLPLLLSVLLAQSTATTQVPDIVNQIRVNAQQKVAQVHTNHAIVSDYKWKYFSEAVQLVDSYHRFVRVEQEKFTAVSSAASAACLDSLPKPLYSILYSADWAIEMCIGHMVVYGETLVEDTEGQLSGFNGIASQSPITSIREFFELYNWNSEAGVEAMHEILLERMKTWDNVSVIELFELKRRIQEEFQMMASNDWPLCVNYGKREVEKLFAEAAKHIGECEEGRRMGN